MSAAASDVRLVLDSDLECAGWAYLFGWIQMIKRRISIEAVVQADPHDIGL